MNLVNHNQNIYIGEAQIFSVLYNHSTLLVCRFFTLLKAIYISHVNILRHKVIYHVNDIFYNIFKSPGKTSWPYFYINILCTLSYILQACLYFLCHTDLSIFGIFIIQMHHRHGNFIDKVQIMYRQLVSIVLAIFGKFLHNDLIIYGTYVCLAYATYNIIKFHDILYHIDIFKTSAFNLHTYSLDTTTTIVVYVYIYKQISLYRKYLDEKLLYKHEVPSYKNSMVNLCGGSSLLNNVFKSIFFLLTIFYIYISSFFLT